VKKYHSFKSKKIKFIIISFCIIIFAKFIHKVKMMNKRHISINLVIINRVILVVYMISIKLNIKFIR